MRIYGGRDYYDCALALGTDPSIVLHRTGKRINLNEAKIPERALRIREPIGRGYREWTTYCIQVVFCAKVYHGVEVDGHYFWSSDSLSAFLQRDPERRTVSIPQPWRSKKVRPAPLASYFEVEDVSSGLREYMIRHRYAILLQTPDPREARHMYRAGNVEVRVNPDGLKHLDFAKALDPYTAFQELSMWVGGVLGGASPEVVTITDDRVLAEGHGFDRYSFRGPRVA